jgi:CBS domain-containing protein
MIYHIEVMPLRIYCPVGSFIAFCILDRRNANLIVSRHIRSSVLSIRLIALQAIHFTTISAGLPLMIMNIICVSIHLPMREVDCLMVSYLFNVFAITDERGGLPHNQLRLSYLRLPVCCPLGSFIALSIYEMCGCLIDVRLALCWTQDSPRRGLKSFVVHSRFAALSICVIIHCVFR